MSTLNRQSYTVEVYPGLFYLTNVNPVGEHDPSDLVPELFDNNAVCMFGDNGITFNSRFQSHVTVVTVEFQDSAPDGAETEPGSALGLPVETGEGAVVLRGGGLVFTNPDQVMLDLTVVPPYLGRSHVRATRRLLVDRATYVPPDEESDPHGLEEWLVSFWPETSNTDNGSSA